MRAPFAMINLVVLLLMIGYAMPAAAVDGQEYEYRLLLDTDANPATGCAVPVEDKFIRPPTTFDGVEQVVIIKVHRDISAGTATVTGITRQVCTHGSFGPELPVSPGAWPVGDGDGVGGADVVEGFVSRADLGDPHAMRVAVVATRAGLSDVLLTRNGAPDGPPMLFVVEPSAVPVVSTWGILVIVLGLGAVAWWSLGRRANGSGTLLLAVIGVVATAATVRAVTIVLDGAVGDWSGVPPLGTDLIGDSSNGDLAEDIVALFMTKDATNVYARVDVTNTMGCGDATDCLTHQACLDNLCVCGGDCNLDGTVLGPEVSTAVQILSGSLPLMSCRAADINGDGVVQTSEITEIVLNLALGCP